MKPVLRSYIPFLVWLALAFFSLLPSPGRASAPHALETSVASARSLLAHERWIDLARMQLPAAGSGIWIEHPDAECELLFVRGLAAARAGYFAMAWHSIERLDGVRCYVHAFILLRTIHGTRRDGGHEREDESDAAD